MDWKSIDEKIEVCKGYIHGETEKTPYLTPSFVEVTSVGVGFSRLDKKTKVHLSELSTLCRTEIFLYKVATLLSNPCLNCLINFLLETFWFFMRTHNPTSSLFFLSTMDFAVFMG